MISGPMLTEPDSQADPLSDSVLVTWILFSVWLTDNCPRGPELGSYDTDKLSRETFASFDSANLTYPLPSVLPSKVRRTTGWTFTSNRMGIGTAPTVITMIFLKTVFGILVSVIRFSYFLL